MKKHNLFSYCFHPKVIVGVLGLIGILFIYPSTRSVIVGMIPFLLILICPLSMVLMMKNSHNDKDKGDKPHEK